ncbi:MAG: hypothetical protein CMB80_18785 [Flammeovirgaceae bacterium]|nr:hypothetical protein [Flammeovirgaceae bacterium]
MPANHDSVHQDLAKFGPKINTLYLKLHDYKYFHTSSNLEKKDNRIIGRSKLKSELFSLLVNGETKNGTYLITGSRGMGKTSLVNDILRKWKNKREFKWRMFLSSWIFGFLLFVIFKSLAGQVIHAIEFSKQETSSQTLIWLLLIILIGSLFIFFLGGV